MTSPTPRGRMSQKRRQHIFSEHCTGHHVAPCCLCGNRIHRHDDEWIIEHVRALGLLGKDTNTNCGPAHVACASEKTHKQDLPRIRKAKRQALTRHTAWRLNDEFSPVLGENESPPFAFENKGVFAPNAGKSGNTNRVPQATLHRDGAKSSGDAKKPARAFQVPAGAVFDWKQKRYVRAAYAQQE